MNRFELKSVPYLDIEDTIAEAGISRRQLSHWEDQGLLHPERGEGSRKYTETDIRRLKALKNLIVDQKLPIPLVKALVEGGAEFGVSLSQTLIETAVLFDTDPSQLENAVLDFENGIVRKHAIASEWWDRMFAVASESTVRRYVEHLTLLLFRIARQSNRKPAAYSEYRDDLISQLQHLADVARVDVRSHRDINGNISEMSAVMSPILPNDDYVDIGSKNFKFMSPAFELRRYRKRLEERMANGESLYAYRGRFWDEDEMQFLSGDPPNTFDDVPF